MKEIESFQNDYQDFEFLLHFRWKKDYERFGEYGELSIAAQNFLKIGDLKDINFQGEQVNKRFETEWEKKEYLKANNLKASHLFETEQMKIPNQQDIDTKLKEMRFSFAEDLEHEEVFSKL